MLESVVLLDTSVIVRYLANDIPHLSAQAAALIQSDMPLGITTVAILEAAFALRNSPYRQTHENIVDSLVDLTRRDNVVGVGVDIAQLTIALMLCRRESPPSFGDALLAATARSAGINEVYSFDQGLERTGMRVVRMPH